MNTRILAMNHGLDNYIASLRHKFIAIAFILPLPLIKQKRLDDKLSSSQHTTIIFKATGRLTHYLSSITTNYLPELTSFRVLKP
ncbi:MAG: hypothetical protein WBA39_18590 [Rivularia sp. (in: cyanobacteria)]